MKALGAEIIELDLNSQPLWVPCYYVIACAEASSNLSRYDGIPIWSSQRSKDGEFNRFNYSIHALKDLASKLNAVYFTGTHVLSSGYFDAYYLQAQKIRRMIQEELLQCLITVDVILGPTTPTCAFKLGEKITDPIQNYLADVFTVAANLAGLPALSIPSGF